MDNVQEIRLIALNSILERGGALSEAQSKEKASLDLLAPEFSVNRSTSSAEDLTQANNREDLNTKARDAGIENPESLPNKVEVANAIVDTQGSVTQAKVGSTPVVEPTTPVEPAQASVPSPTSPAIYASDQNSAYPSEPNTNQAPKYDSVASEPAISTKETNADEKH